MDEHLHAIEVRVRGTPEYNRAMELLEQEEKLRSSLREIEHQLESLAVAGKLARVDRIRKLIMGAGSATVLAG